MSPDGTGQRVQKGARKEKTTKKTGVGARGPGSSWSAHGRRKRLRQISTLGLRFGRLGTDPSCHHGFKFVKAVGRTFPC